MTSNLKLSKIRALLGMEVKLAQAKLADGTTIEAEQFAPEFSVGVVTQDGIVPMPVGEYEMEDGKILSIAQEGIIAEIKEAAAPAEEVVEEVEAKKDEVEEVKAKRIVESVSKETFFEAVEKLTKENDELKAKITELSATPAPEPIVANPENKKQEVIAYVKRASLKSEIYKQLFN
jgi:NADH dehydrogenase/NADH:ubiquinone oxidoreductase subunit G